MARAVGLDLSLTGSGICRVDATPVCPVDGGQVTTSGGRHAPRCINAVCRYEGPGDATPRVEHQRLGSNAAGQDVADRSIRLRNLAARILAACEGADLVLVESPAYSKNMGSMHDRSGLWWLVMARLTAHGVPCAEVTSGTLKVYATGVGRGSKDVILSETVRRYADLAPNLSTNDEADALVLAAMAWHRLTDAPLLQLPQTHTRALKAVHWPTTT